MERCPSTVPPRHPASISKASRSSGQRSRRVQPQSAGRGNRNSSGRSTDSGPQSGSHHPSGAPAAQTTNRNRGKPDPAPERQVKAPSAPGPDMPAKTVIEPKNPAHPKRDPKTPLKSFIEPPKESSNPTTTSKLLPDTSSPVTSLVHSQTGSPRIRDPSPSRSMFTQPLLSSQVNSPTQGNSSSQVNSPQRVNSPSQENSSSQVHSPERVNSPSQGNSSSQVNSPERVNSQSQVNSPQRVNSQSQENSSSQSQRATGFTDREATPGQFPRGTLNHDTTSTTLPQYSSKTSDRPGAKSPKDPKTPKAKSHGQSGKGVTAQATSSSSVPELPSACSSESSEDYTSESTTEFTYTWPHHRYGIHYLQHCWKRKHLAC
ncbi:receptor expression-enhancing protein 6 isoform X4 [Sorex fumeus]|uniref:receptor expression-enhancing protein 6 isoform X4 n=1 Tax=Sorex fumeus TaxID=62283 RepID=UPI0024AD69C3|nr:receptor expression-enhancing protein 6 isoform X4 [Sorex fumeus]